MTGESPSFPSMGIMVVPGYRVVAHFIRQAKNMPWRAGLDHVEESLRKYIRHMLETGTGADRQLRVFEETGDLKAVVDYMVKETSAGLF